MFSVKQHINNKVVMFTLLSHSFRIFYCLFDSSKGGGEDSHNHNSAYPNISQRIDNADFNLRQISLELKTILVLYIKTILLNFCSQQYFN
jgi:hypothetical protein